MMLGRGGALGEGVGNGGGRCQCTALIAAIQTTTTKNYRRFSLKSFYLELQETVELNP